MALARRLERELGASVRCVARLGAPQAGQMNSLPFMHASSIRPGMAMFTTDGGYDCVVGVERVESEQTVIDIDVEHTHNFVANGLLVHNSVYGFRGADIANILNFRDDYPDAHVVKLEQNYRSTQTILSAANAVVAHNRGRMSKALWTDIGEGDPIRVREMADEHAEARFVAAEIERMVDEGVSRAEIADLLPHQRAVAGAGGHARAGPDRLPGDRRHEVLRARGDPRRDRLPDLPGQPAGRGGVHARGQLAAARARARRRSRACSATRTRSGIPVWEAAAEPDTVAGLGTAAQKALGRFMSTMQRLRERVEGEAPVGELVQEMLSETGYLEALEAERTIEAQGRIENLEELVHVAREYDATAEDGGSMGEFLQQISLLADADAREDDEGLVTLMTMHNAKGLEYPIVFMIGMEDGVFPHSRALDEGALEEERRLAYVGITRAMRDLTLTHARRRNSFGANSFGVRSRFIDEIPRELTDQPEREARGLPTGRIASWAGRGGGVGRGRGRRGRRRPGVPDGRRRRARGVRRRRGDGHRAGRDRRRPVRRRRQRAQADGRLCARQEALSARLTVPRPAPLNGS